MKVTSTLPPSGHCVLRNIDNQKKWFPGCTASEVLERDADGNPSKARLVNDVKIAKDEFELDYVNNPQGFSWKLSAPTKVQKYQEGSWTVVTRAASPRPPSR